VTSPKTSSKVIIQNNSSNNFFSAMFVVKSGKTKALNKLFKELFDIHRSMYPFWYYPKNCLFPHVSLFVPFSPLTEDIPEKDVNLKGGDTFEFGSAAKVQVFDMGGHTKGHIAYYFTERESKK
jgi:glyoxylase-like metal-dependent hydrolase (beta-lactamase superfamily II)